MQKVNKVFKTAKAELGTEKIGGSASEKDSYTAKLDEITLARARGTAAICEA